MSHCGQASSRLTSLVFRTLVNNHEIAVASPAYLETHGTPETADDLTHHGCIIGYSGRNAPDPRWPLLEGGWTQVSGTLMTNHVGLRVEAAKRDLGIAIALDRLVADSLASGELVWVLPDIVGRLDQARLVYPDREFLDPKVRAFVDFIAGRIEATRG